MFPLKFSFQFITVLLLIFNSPDYTTTDYTNWLSSIGCFFVLSMQSGIFLLLKYTTTKKNKLLIGGFASLIIIYCGIIGLSLMFGSDNDLTHFLIKTVAFNFLGYDINFLVISISFLIFMPFAELTSYDEKDDIIKEINKDSKTEKKSNTINTKLKHNYQRIPNKVKQLENYKSKEIKSKKKQPKNNRRKGS